MQSFLMNKKKSIAALTILHLQELAFLDRFMILHDWKISTLDRCCLCLWGSDISFVCFFLKVRATLNAMCVNEELEYFCNSCLTYVVGNLEIDIPCHLCQ